MFGKPRKGWIGIDIGSCAVKIAQLVWDPHGYRISRAAIIPRIRPWFHEPTSMPSRPIDSHAEIFGAYACGKSWGGRLAACVLPMHVYDFRGLHLPSGTHSQRRTMILSELAETWDFFEDGCEFDFWDTQIPGVKFRKDEPNINILALSKLWARQAANDINRAGLRCTILDGPPLATARAIGLLGSKQNADPVAVVDWGYTNTTFSVVIENRPVFLRRIRGCGLGQVIQVIQASLGITFDQTQYLLQTVGFPNPDSSAMPERPAPRYGPASAALQAQEHGDADHPSALDIEPLRQAFVEAAVEPICQLLDQINRTLAYFQAQRRALIPAKLWFTGGGGAIRNAAAYLGRDISIPAEPWRLPESTTQQDNANSVPPALLAGAIGLSLLARDNGYVRHAKTDN